MRILITASRNWADPEIIWSYLDVVYIWWLEQNPAPEDEFIVVHGAARGGDTHAKQWAAERCKSDPRVDDDPHPAQWEKYRRPVGRNPAGHIRNKEMVDARADICMGFPLQESPGTRGCLKLAVVADIPAFCYEDGAMQPLNRECIVVL